MRGKKYEKGPEQHNFLFVAEQIGDDWVELVQNRNDKVSRSRLGKSESGLRIGGGGFQAMYCVQTPTERHTTVLP